MTNVRQIIEQLEELMDKSPALPLSNKKLIDEDAFFTLVQRLKMALPKEAVAPPAAQGGNEAEMSSFVRDILDRVERYKAETSKREPESPWSSTLG